MDEIKKAIKYFEDAIQESDEIIEESSEPLKAELIEQRKHFVVAVKTMKRESLKVITIQDIKEYQDKMETVKANGFKANEFKALGRELQSKFGLTVPEITAILNNRANEILEILFGEIRKGGQENMARNGIEEINKICKAVLKLQNSDFEEAEKMCEGQENYCHPLKNATTRKQNALGEYNRKVIVALKALRNIIKSEADGRTGDKM